MKTAVFFLVTVYLLYSISAEPIVILEGDKDLSRVYRKGWVEIEDDHSLNRTTTLTIAIKQRNMDVLTKNAHEVSNPSSAKYGQYMTHKQIIELSAPTPEVIAQISGWLYSHKISYSHMSLNPSKDFMILRNVPIDRINSLLNVQLKPYRHLRTQAVVYRSMDHYSVPTSIAPLIDYIGGITSFPKHESRFTSPYYDPIYVKALPSGNGPVISRILPGDGEIGGFFLIRCKNGDVTSNAADPCSSNGPALTSISLSLAQNGNPITQTSDVPLKSLKCKSCRDWNTGSFGSDSYLCNSTVITYNISYDSIFCNIPAFGSVKNYIPIQVSLYSTFNDSSKSDVTANENDIYTGEFVTPLTLTNRYKVPQGTVAVTGSQSVAEFLDQYFSVADLNLFFKSMGLPITNVTIIGPNDQSQPGGEASLDIQYLLGIAPNITTVFWSVGGTNNGQEPFDVWMTNVLNDAGSPLVHSVSYGDDEPSLSVSYMNRVNNEFIKAANKGLSLLFASGDSGVNSGDPANTGCPNQHFVPSFPPTSPWVTVVGATQFSTQTRPICNSFTANSIPIVCSEVGEITSSTTTGSRISSGGGFSEVFAQPDYQSDAVFNYLTNSLNNVPKSYFNSSGRAYPDVAACGRNYIVVIGGLFIPVDGTSAATPTFAAIVSLLNGLRIAYGHAPLGFLNPYIYSVAPLYPETFFDITMGSNECGQDLSKCCKYGLSAAVGWDATTGWGTPNFAVLSSLLAYGSVSVN